MAPHPSTLAWKIPWMEEPGRLRSMGSLRVRHDTPADSELQSCESFLWDISSRVPLVSHLDLPRSESIFGLSLYPLACAHASLSRD